jgi:hypothetical protein
MKLLDRFEYVKQLWALILPATPLPPNGTIFGWLSAFSNRELEAVLARMPHRMDGRTLSNEEVYRCISAILRDARKTRPRGTNVCN